MAKEKVFIGVSKSQMPTFTRTSKMRNYDLVYDEKVQQVRPGFYSASNFKGYQPTATDVIWTVESGYEHRTDLISTKFYQSSIYDWIIEDANNIGDPIKEIVVGKKLIIPDRSKVYSSNIM
jgi:hypothetical protein